MLVYHFINPDLGFEIFFQKEGATEKGDVGFEIGVLGTSAHLCWGLKKISCRDYLLFLKIFLVGKTE